LPLLRAVWKDVVNTLHTKGITSPMREARFILAQLLCVSPSRLCLFWDHEVNQAFLTSLTNMLEERLRGVPLQYVLGEWEFLSLPFWMEKGVFIPRFDTEAWVEEAIVFLRFLAQRQQILTVCDMGCGSGVIGISCAFWVRETRVYSVDISLQALALAEKNARQIGVADQMIFIHSDLFQALSPADLRFDVILSNPPYVTPEDWDTLSAEIRNYEPREALLGGEEGVDVIQRIIEEGVPFLKEGGTFFIEHDPRQKETIQAMVARKPALEYVRHIEDYQGRVRASVIRKKG